MRTFRRVTVPSGSRNSPYQAATLPVVSRWGMKYPAVPPPRAAWIAGPSPVTAKY
jgi:hypothetical protein